MRPALLPAVAIVTILAATPGAGAGGAHDPAPPPAADTDDRTPAQRMNARFPQKVRVGDLLGLPVQDVDDRILGTVTDVARTADGGIVLVMPEGGFLWRAGRPVAIPIETVEILARHLNLIDIPRDAVPKLPTWDTAQGTPIARDDIIRVAVGRR